MAFFFLSPSTKLLFYESTLQYPLVSTISSRLTTELSSKIWHSNHGCKKSLKLWCLVQCLHWKWKVRPHSVNFDSSFHLLHWSMRYIIPTSIFSVHSISKEISNLVVILSKSLACPFVSVKSWQMHWNFQTVFIYISHFWHQVKFWRRIDSFCLMQQYTFLIEFW